jgi:membrane protein implicated in regulation of membrane protease activity
VAEQRPGVGHVLDADEIERILDACQTYWLDAGLERSVVAGMRVELEGHLQHAAAEGKTAQAVIGNDLGRFAESWAKETGRDVPGWGDVDEEKARRRRRTIWTVAGIAAVALIAVSVVVATEERDTAMEDSTWIWIWLGAAVIFAFGEVLTAGFFMLPFAAGAAAAFITAVFGAPIALQWVVFIGVSIVALFALRRFVQHEDEIQAPVGANRFAGKKAVVLETIDPPNMTGMVRMGTEEWRAVTADGGTIQAGSHVVVTDVDGVRLVVELPDRVEEMGDETM